MAKGTGCSFPSKNEEDAFFPNFRKRNNICHRSSRRARTRVVLFFRPFLLVEIESKVISQGSPIETKEYMQPVVDRAEANTTPWCGHNALPVKRQYFPPFPSDRGVLPELVGSSLGLTTSKEENVVIR